MPEVDDRDFNLWLCYQIILSHFERIYQSSKLVSKYLKWTYAKEIMRQQLQLCKLETLVQIELKRQWQD
jgi:hypothetical protein